MRKFLLSLGVGLLSLVGLTANAATTASGTMSANYNTPDGKDSKYNVTVEYNANANTLTIKNIDICNPLIMEIKDGGSLVSKPNQISSILNDYGEDLTFYYSDFNKEDLKVYGKIVDDKTITLDDFGEYWVDYSMFYTNWYNIKIELDNPIDFDDNGGGTVDPTPGDSKNLFVGTRNGSGLWEFDETNPLGVKFAMSFYKSTSYGNYNKLTWTTYSNYTYSQKDGKYYFVVPATYNPETGRYVINDYSQLRNNHIRFDCTADSKQVYEGIYFNTAADQSGAVMENVYVVVASYKDLDRSELIAVEKAYALKGGEFKGATDGSFPDLVNGTLDNGKKYQWELLFDEVEVIQPDPDPEGTGNITATGQYYDSGWQNTEVNSTVKGRYYLDTKVLKVTGIQMKEGKTTVFEPLELTLDPTTGNVEANANLACYSSGLPCYYADYNATVANATNKLTGKIENTGENESTLTLTDWGDLMYWNNGPYTFNETKWFDTKIVFPFAIPDLPAYVEPEPEPITGKANFTATYQPWNGSSYPISKVVNFTYDDNKITIPGTEINGAYTDDLILPIDWDTMTIKTQYCWCYTYENVFPVYYADYYPATESSKRTGWLTGTVQNVDGKTIITLSTWGELMWYQGAGYGYYGDGTWANTQIEFSLTNEPTPAELKLSFVGDNFELDTDINDYLTIQDQGALISSGGEDMGMINITSNPFSFVPNMEMGGMYMLTLTHKDGYLLTAEVAPGTPEDTQISIQDGQGNVMISGQGLDSDLEIIVTINKEATEPSVLYFAQPYQTIPAANPQTLEETEPGVYEGTVKIAKGLSYFGFYTVEGDVITKYSKGGFGSIGAMDFPYTDEMQENPTGIFSWYITAYPDGCQGNFDVTVDLNTLTLTIEPVFEAAPAPDAIYLWATDRGYSYNARYTNWGTFEKAADADVYTLKGFEVPACGIFVPDGEYTAPAGAPDYGFYFFLSDNATSNSAGTQYLAPQAASEEEANPAIINLSMEDNTYSVVAKTKIQGGSNFIVLNPGTYDFTFNYETREFKAVLIEEANQVQLNFVGEGNIASPYKKVTVMTMLPEPETLTVSDPQYLISYWSAQGINIIAEEGYTVSVTCDKAAANDTYGISSSDADGLNATMISVLPGANGYVFTVTVSEEVAVNAYLGIAEGQAPTAPNMDYVLTSDDEGMTFTGELTIQPGQSFNIWYPANINTGAEGDENEDTPAVKYQPLGPASDEEVELYFTTADVTFSQTLNTTLSGFWTLMNEEAVSIRFTLDMATRTLTSEALSDNLPEPTPEINALVFEDFEIELGKTPTTVEVPVSIQADEAFTYQGIQFTVTLPEGLTIPEEGGIVLNAPLNGNATWNTSDDLYGAPNTTGVVVLLTEPTEAVEDILTISVTGEYGSLAAGSYPVTIQSVGFSDARGNDIETPEFEAFTGYVTVTEAEVPAEEIIIDSVTLNEPSFTEEENDMVSEVVAGESVDMTITVKPADTTDEVEVTADNGATVTENEDGTWTVDTSGVVVPEGEESVTVTITITAGDVEETYELTVKCVLLGDSNDNGVVTVADVVTTANYIAEKPIDAFCFPNANVILTEVDGEQVIDAQDLSATVNIVLENWNGIRNPQNIRRHANRVVSNDRLVASDFHAGHSVIGISLENTMNYSVLQATVELPAGMKVENVTAGPRAAAHELVYNVKGSELNVVLFSYENASFRDGEGTLFNIAVAADENCGDLQMRNIMAADASANGYELSFEGGLNAGTTGIEVIGSDSEGVRYFTVDGIEVLNPEAGQLLIRVANGTAEKVLVK